MRPPSRRKTTKMLGRPAPGAARQEGGRPEAPQPPKPPTGLYVGLGVGGLALVVVLAMVMSQGGDSRRSGPSLEAQIAKIHSRAIEAGNAGNRELALQILSEALDNAKFRGNPRLKECRLYADALRAGQQAERDAVIKVADLKKRIQAAK